MDEKLKQKVADWGVFFGALFVILANPAGILGTVQSHLRLGYSAARTWSLELRTFVGKHIAMPIVAFYACTVAIIDVLAYATLKAAASTTPAIQNHWSHGFVFWAAAIGTVTMTAHAADLLRARYKHPVHMPFVTGAVFFHLWLRVMYVAVIVHAIAASSELALLPAAGLVVVVFATAYLASLALGWIAEKSIELIEAGGAVVGSAVGVGLPGVSTEDMKKFTNFFKNEAWRAAPLKLTKDEITVHAIFLFVISLWPTPAMAEYAAPAVYVTGLLGIVAKMNGLGEKVDERRKATVWQVCRWAWLALPIARAILEVPVIKGLWSALRGRSVKSIDWATNVIDGNQSVLPVMKFWTAVLLTLVAFVLVHYAWKWSVEMGKWGKGALRGGSGLFLVLMLVFGLPNAKCGSSEDNGRSPDEQEKTEQQEPKDKPLPPPPAKQQPTAKPAATPPARTSTAQAKAPSQMSQAELDTRLADIAARRKTR